MKKLTTAFAAVIVIAALATEIGLIIYHLIN